MAKRKAESIDDILPIDEDGVEVAVDEEPAMVVETIVIEIPIVRGIPSSHFVDRRYDAYLDSASQAQAMNALSTALRMSGAVVKKTGRPVTEKTHVLRWLAEAIAEQIEKSS